MFFHPDLFWNWGTYKENLEVAKMNKKWCEQACFHDSTEALLNQTLHKI